MPNGIEGNLSKPLVIMTVKRLAVSPTNFARFASVIVVLLCSSCVGKNSVEFTTTSKPDYTLNQTPIPLNTPLTTTTPVLIETQTLPSLPEGVSTLTVYNYETGKDEVLSPTFDEEMDTYVWKNSKDEVRRFLDIETGHIFAQTESVRDNLIYQIDTEFGWEADLTEFTKKNKGYSPAALSYLYMLQNDYSSTITVFGENTKLVFKIVHGSYDDIVDKSKISSIKDREEPNLQMSFFRPTYNAKYDSYFFTTYLNYDHIRVNDAIGGYTQDMLNGCLTNNFPSGDFPVGVLDLPISKKPIQ
ncbi:MAG: hypothetical protein HPY72_08565 [Anaerolineae bacterium]|nr:hypothetical protein [Anaerolineae bacterium]